MKSPKTAKLVCIYIHENDRWRGKPLYVALTQLLREKNIGVVTVIRGRMGVGPNGIIKDNHFWPIHGDYPIILECLDQADRINAVLPEINRMLTKGKYIVVDGEMWENSNGRNFDR
ncbi:DUF190 domain-containing protein [Desulfosporosinus sp. FKA]|uniref:DUF190 domain-containing protein n=1 Tax=Desulfosporosinus sp. FKA TaxID=1969834 RepID=UPI001554B2D0|nr:DUF190 domain-containing protein [Desulfosporosinus sp. FKA]